MLDFFLWILVFVVSIYVLVKSSSYFTESAEKIGAFFGISSFVIGITIVAFGTSLPELAASVIAALNCSPEIVSGVVVGSNIANMLLVIGVCALVSGSMKLSWNMKSVDIPVLVLSVLFLCITMGDGMFTFSDAVCGIFIYSAYSAYLIRSNGRKDKESLVKDPIERRTVMILFLSCFFEGISEKYTVVSLSELSGILGISKDIIALFAVALGTSLPELSVSLAAAKQKNFDMTVGNVIGSNIFNSFVVMGVPGLFAVLPVTPVIVSFSLPLMVVALVLFVFAIKSHDISFFEGLVSVMLYAFFVLKIFGIV